MLLFITRVSSKQIVYISQTKFHIFLQKWMKQKMWKLSKILQKYFCKNLLHENQRCLKVTINWAKNKQNYVVPELRLSLVIHLVSYKGSWKHKLKQNSIFSLEHWKRSLTPRGNTSHALWYRCEDWTAMVDTSEESFQGS